MPKTDAEWQALDHRIAREVMGLLTWDDLTAAEQQSYIDVVPKQFLDMSMEEWKRSYWKREYGHVFTVDDYSGWQPHQNVAQAMLALRTLLTKIGHHATAKIAMRPSASLYHTTIQNWVSTGGVPAMLVRSPHVDNETHAICLAIEACLNTQGMPDWASG